VTTAPRRLRRGALSTTVFGLSALGAAGYLLVTAGLFVAVIWQLNRVFAAEVFETLSAEVRTLAAVSKQGDAAGRVRSIVEQLSASGNARLYYLEGKGGEKLAGNLAKFPPELASGNGGLFVYRFDRGPESRERYAAGLAVRLDSGDRLVVARDIEDQRELIWWLRLMALLGFTVVALGGLGLGLMASRGILLRVEALTSATRGIMAGDLAGRLPVKGTGDEFDRLSENVNIMLARIEHLMHGLKEVSDNIAHDLKTPVNRLRNRAEETLRTANTPGELRTGLEEVIESADEIIKTFNALLLIARLEAGAIEETKSPVPLAGLLADAVELYEPLAEEAGLRLEYQQEADITARANRHLLGQAVINLIDNAIKYSRHSVKQREDHGRVFIGLKQQKGRAVITVADNGPGICAADRARVMERFVRLDKSRTLPGTGLGLSLVAAVARLHGGELRLEDNKPGLRAVITLPL
jgi:signal transduction histidine kinase